MNFSEQFWGFVSSFFECFSAFSVLLNLFFLNDKRNHVNFYLFSFPFCFLSL